MIQYKGHTITDFGSGFTVFCDGEEIFFPTEQEAREFIDELE